jgi:hypothetical protein
MDVRDPRTIMFCTLPPVPLFELMHPAIGRGLIQRKSLSKTVAPSDAVLPYFLTGRPLTGTSTVLYRLNQGRWRVRLDPEDITTT